MLPSQIQELYDFRRLIGYLAWGRIKAGEREKTFGKFWSLINPLALLAIYYFVFNVLFTSNVENFALFLFTAIIAWRFFSQSVTLSAVIITSNRGLITEAYFPKAALPVTAVMLIAYDYLFALGVLLIMALFLGVSIGTEILLWPVIFAVQFIFTLGFAILAAALGVFFRDLQNVLNLVFRLGFYLSGVMYPISRVPEPLRVYFELNPMHTFFESYRSILLYHQLPPFFRLGAVLLISLLLLAVALRFMGRTEGTFLKYL